MKKEAVREQLHEIEDELYSLNEWMYENPELGFQEYEASRKLTAMLEEAGFVVEKPVAGKETAFVTRYGDPEAHPAVALFAEYDALPDIGHACGHNIIASSSIGAAIALVRAWPDIPGSLYVFGSPAEEQSSVIDDCGGKVYMVEAGLLEGIDAAMMLHPTNFNSAWTNNLAVQPLEMTFHGRTAQPAGSAHMGINAFEASVLAYTNINACRQYFMPDHYAHGMVTESGPAPNIMSPRSKLRLHVRAPKDDQLEEFLGLIKRCGEAAAHVTGAEVEFDYYMKRYKDVIVNHVLGELMEKNMKTLGLEVEPMAAHPRASTDMGNVSYAVPAIHGYVSVGPGETVGNTHSPEFAPSTVAEEGRGALFNAAASMALTVFDLFADPSLVEKAKREFSSRK